MHFLPTCDLIFYFTLHMQRLHINGPISNKPCTSDPPVGLAKTILFVLIPEIKHKHKGVKCFTRDSATKRLPGVLALGFSAPDVRGSQRLSCSPAIRSGDAGAAQTLHAVLASIKSL